MALMVFSLIPFLTFNVPTRPYLALFALSLFCSFVFFQIILALLTLGEWSEVCII